MPLLRSTQCQPALASRHRRQPSILVSQPAETEHCPFADDQPFIIVPGTHSLQIPPTAPPTERSASHPPPPPSTFDNGRPRPLPGAGPAQALSVHELGRGHLTPLKGEARPPQAQRPHAEAFCPGKPPRPRARDIRAGALFAIRARNPEAFTRYVQQLQPFYELPSARLPPNLPERNKVTGLSLLLLLTQGRYAEFHSELESLANRDGGGSTGDVEGDRYLGYPIRLERWLMEGSYDRVWKAMKSSEVPCDEYSVFSEILKNQIRSEIASSSERAYPSLPISSTKSLLFLDSEGDVIQFAKHRGWIVRDGNIFFPDSNTETSEDGAQSKDLSQMVIENTLGYARELETIV
ncbi:hypothetical protein ACCO45_008772 [Purpureocillium lilacinum]|uniref:Uncharacterized protein n=1 Tax=Purpureocillium lilacinum TaxID=33203 RepID=A0ACC4DI60_PURLI